MSKIVVSLSVEGIDKILEALDAEQEKIEGRADQIVETLARHGAEEAQTRFKRAQYDGTNDVAVKPEKRGRGRAAVVAKGNAAVFIEFGTGVTYDTEHPEKPAGFGPGSYGQGKGSRHAWGYYGDPGSRGQVSKETDKGTLVITHGNPANKCMYESRKTLEERIGEITREVFNR